MKKSGKGSFWALYIDDTNGASIIRGRNSWILLVTSAELMATVQSWLYSDCRREVGSPSYIPKRTLKISWALLSLTRRPIHNFSFTVPSFCKLLQENPWIVWLKRCILNNDRVAFSLQSWLILSFQGHLLPLHNLHIGFNPYNDKLPGKLVIWRRHWLGVYRWTSDNFE